MKRYLTPLGRISFALAAVLLVAVSFVSAQPTPSSPAVTTGGTTGGTGTAGPTPAGGGTTGGAAGTTGSTPAANGSTGAIAPGSLLGQMGKPATYATTALDTSNFLADKDKFGWVADVWSAIRQMSNILIVVFLFIGALATTLNYNLNTYGIKKVLPAVVQAAIIANFSFVLINAGVEAVGLLQKGLLGIGIGGASVSNGTWDTLAGPLKDILAGFTPTKTTEVGQLFWGLIASIGVGIAMLLLWLVVGILYLRSFIIAMLVAFAPLAILSMALPATQGLWKKYWEEFTKWLLLPIIVAFWLMVASLIAGIASLPAMLKAFVAMFAVFQAVRVPFSFKPAILGAAIGAAGGYILGSARTAGRAVGGVAMNSARYGTNWALVGNRLTRNNLGAAYRGTRQWYGRFQQARATNVKRWQQGEVFQGIGSAADRRKARLQEESAFEAWRSADPTNRAIDNSGNNALQRWGSRFDSRRALRRRWQNEQAQAAEQAQAQLTDDERRRYVTGQLQTTDQQRAFLAANAPALLRPVMSPEQVAIAVQSTLTALNGSRLNEIFDRQRRAEAERYGRTGMLGRLRYQLEGGETGVGPLGGVMSRVNAWVSARETNLANIEKEHGLEGLRSDQEAAERYGGVMQRSADLATAEETVTKSIEGLKNHWKTIALTSQTGSAKVLRQERQFAEERARLMENGLKMAQSRLTQALHTNNSPEQLAFNRMMAGDGAANRQLQALGLNVSNGNYLEAATVLSARSAAVAGIAEGTVKNRELRVAHRQASRHDAIMKYANESTPAKRTAELDKLMDPANAALRTEVTAHLAGELGIDANVLAAGGRGALQDAMDRYSATGAYENDQTVRNDAMERVRVARDYVKRVAQAKGEAVESTVKFTPVEKVTTVHENQLTDAAASANITDKNALYYTSVAAAMAKAPVGSINVLDAGGGNHIVEGDHHFDAIRIGEQAVRALHQKAKRGPGGGVDWEAADALHDLMGKSQLAARLSGMTMPTGWDEAALALDTAVQKSRSFQQTELDRLAGLMTTAKNVYDGALASGTPAAQEEAKKKYDLANSEHSRYAQSKRDAEEQLRRALDHGVFRPFVTNE